MNKYWMLGVYCLVSFPLFSQITYLEINLNEPIVQGGFFSVQSRPALNIFRVIEKAGKDRKIHGIVLNIGSFSGSRDFIWELRNVLEQFKAEGKKICAFFSAADIDTYCLASVADKIVMDEQGTLNILGYTWGRGYVQHSLEKLGIGVRELRYMEYKSSAEMFTRDSMSEADRIQSSEYLDDIFNLTRETLMKARNWTNDDFETILNKEFLYSAKSAQNRNLVDYTGRKDAVTEAVKEIEGAEVKHFVLYGDPKSSMFSENENYRPPRAGGLFKRPPVIAIVYANGQTDMERGMSVWNLAKIIRDLSKEKRVKAIVVRINSPGGSAEAADHIAEAISYAKQKKPVVVSMGQMAASGGYWAAVNASHITANPYTVTGSIGVIGSRFYDNGLNDKLGLTLDVLQRGAHADLMSGFLLPSRDLSREEEARYKDYIMDLYNVFINKVSAGRNMDIEKVEVAAQGRIYSGIRALDAGLIDSIGGISDAIRTARTLANIPEDTSVMFRVYPRPKFMDRILARISAASGFFGSKSNRAAVFGAEVLADIFLPLEDVIYRLERNGQVMPVLPIGFLPLSQSVE